MQTNNKRYYTPQFSESATVSVRRLAWAIGKKMPTAVNLMVQLIPLVVNTTKICAACQDKSKCQVCSFHNPAPSQGLEAFEAIFNHPARLVPGHNQLFKEKSKCQSKQSRQCGIS